MRYLALLFSLFSALAIAQSTRKIGVVDEYTITSFPLYGAVVTPSDTVALATAGAVRANGAGNLKIVCVGNSISQPITLTVVAGEFVPCLVKYVFSTGTTVATIHVFY